MHYTSTKKAIRVYESLFLYDYKKLAYSAAFSSLAASAVGASATDAVAFLRERLVLGAFLAACLLYTSRHQGYRSLVREPPVRQPHLAGSRTYHHQQDQDPDLQEMDSEGRGIMSFHPLP